MFLSRMRFSIQMLSFTCATVLVAAAISGAADFPSVDPSVFSKDDPKSKELPKMMSEHLKKRMQEANLRETKAFADVTTREQWERYRDVRIKALRDSLGDFPEVPKDMKIEITRKIEGEGYVIHNLLYETRPQSWVTANLYLPAKFPDSMPGIILSAAHHTPKGQGELQDMGMTWARNGVAVLVPDHYGYGERRTHDFRNEKDFDKPFRVGRQDYYFRYNTNLQLTAVGESLMGRLAWDLMRGVDVLLKQKNIDSKRIILMGAVAGGGDPAGVTAALDSRIACVVPFNFGGWQPESRVLENPDQDFAWFGDGYWESTRGLRNGARDGFAHFVIVGSVAPRKVIYAHEFAWDAKTDPAWPRLEKIFGFYNAKDALRVAHGAGTVRASGPGNTHCTHIGAVHRKMIYPALKDWFNMPIPEEYSKRRTPEELICWTEEAKTKAKFPIPLGSSDFERAAKQALEKSKSVDNPLHKTAWASALGNIDPVSKPKVTEVKTEQFPTGPFVRFILETDPGIVVPGLLFLPKDAKGKVPVVVMVAQAGKSAFFKKRGEALEAFLNANVAVCLIDVRGTGETQPGTSASRSSSRTGISQTNAILGQPILGSQLRDLRTAIHWLKSKNTIDGKRIAVWGDSFAEINAKDANLKAPLDANDAIPVAEPGADLLAMLAATFESDVKAAYARGGLTSGLLDPYVYVPHDAMVPGLMSTKLGGPDSFYRGHEQTRKREALVNSQNQGDGKAMAPADAAKWVIERLR